MHQIVSPIQIIQKILGVQRMTGDVPCRLSAHCMRVERSEGLLLYHTLTGELLLLSPDEAASLGKLPGPVSPELGELAARWFLVPEGTDDMVLAGQVREIAERFEKKEAVLTDYMIFTTTVCNARCFYCYEASWEKQSMTEQTALDTAHYIMVHCGGRPVRIQWFGGEPLANTKAIDIITGFLRQQGIEFHSTMISNGYLFDEVLVQRARDIWNLERVQITLDGTEDIYNWRKAYVNPTGSPYRRVLRNICLLLDTGISIQVRLNMDKDNEDDLYALIDELAEQFAGKSGFGIYLMAIYENAGIDPPSYTEEERCAYAQKLQSLRDYAEEKGIAARFPLKRKFSAHACSADNNRYSTVMPDGRLGRCEACKDGAIWGSIYSDEVDEEVFRQWRERKPPEAVCKDCVIYPQCIRIKKCPSWLEYCSPIERARRKDMLYRAVLGAYEDWKASGAT